MSTVPDSKLPAIERIKSRKDGLDVLADVYRYAELGFDAIDPDDLQLFRWYGLYTQRSEESAASGEPGPSEDTDGYFMLRVKFPGGAVTADQMRTPRARTCSSTGWRSRICRSCSTS
jgi:sulfite reductase beta subunit-like hemoprotein